MLIYKNSYVGSKIIELCNLIEKSTLSKCLTDLDGNFEYIFYTGNGYDFYIDYKRKEVYVYCLDENVSNYIKGKLHNMSNQLNDLYLYLEWLKHSQECI